MPPERLMERGGCTPEKASGGLDSILHSYIALFLACRYAKTSWNEVKRSRSSGATWISNSSSTNAMSVAVASESQAAIVVELARRISS
jgi:hypothetical protein